MCTLRNFPHLIEHCLEWSRSMFADLFVSPAQLAAQFLSDSDEFLKKERASTLDLPAGPDRRNNTERRLGDLRSLQRTLQQAFTGPSMSDCVAMAFDIFHAYFRDRLIDLTTLPTGFPEVCYRRIYFICSIFLLLCCIYIFVRTRKTRRLGSPSGRVTANFLLPCLLMSATLCIWTS